MATIPLGLYLWQRIAQLGTQSIMGVPGDFNMQILDYIYQVPALKWRGSANELNAAYAADGYARTKGVPGVFVTTHGVGELSALNGVAGSMSEHVPVIHVVGQIGRAVQQKGLMIHHSIGMNPDYQVYNKASRNFRCAAAELWDDKTAAAEIDRTLRECVVQKLPVYIFFPLDMVEVQVPAELLDTPIDTGPSPIIASNEDQALHAILQRLENSKNPMIFVDFLTQHHAKQETRGFVDAAQLPVFSSYMGRGVVHEDKSYYKGMYNGAASDPGIAETIQASDFVLALGWWFVDTNTATFTRKISPHKRIDIMDNHVMIDGKKLDGVYMAPLLIKLTEAISRLRLPRVDIPQLMVKRDLTSKNKDMILHSYMWPRLGEFLREGDVLLADTGTSAFGLADAKFPGNMTWIAQTYWMSIGYATPASLGVDLALHEMHEASKNQRRGRTILVTGDGSLQLTIQEIGSMITHGMKPLIFIINNSGYAIEKAIHGAKCSYNNINTHSYAHLLGLYNHPNAGNCYRKVSTPDELEAVLEDEAVKELRELQIVEVVMEPLDLPWRLKMLLEAREGMREYLEGEGFRVME